MMVEQLEVNVSIISNDIKATANIVFAKKRAESKLSSLLFPLAKLLFLKQSTNLVLAKQFA